MKVKIIAKDNYKEIRKIKKAFTVTDSNKADICMAIGGDGTFMLAAEGFDGPILPIRTDEPGSAGFYADIGIKEIDKAIKLLKSNSYRIEPLSNKIAAEYKKRNNYAVNEVMLRSTDEEIYFTIWERKGIKRTRIYPYVMAGDGVLITGVVGSTAYNKSANGPIMLAKNAMCITFLNCDGPYKNSIVVDSSQCIEIRVEKASGQLKCDNNVVATLKKGDSFVAKLSKKQLWIVRFPGLKEELHSKLGRLIMRKAIDKID